MKVKACLVGLSMALLTGQTEGWFVFNQIFRAIVNIFVPPAPAPAPILPPKPAKTKTVLMRKSIVPTWQELAPKGAVKIKLARVKSFWEDLEASDLKTYGSLFATAAEIKLARASIENYYDQGLKCLLVDKIQEQNTPEVFKARMEILDKCLLKTPIPTFTVADTSTVTPALPSYVPGDNLDADDYPVKLPDPTTQPPIVVTIEPKTHAPVETPINFVSDPAPIAPIVLPVLAPSEPETYPPPVEVAVVAKSEQPSWTYSDADFHPRLRSVPDFRAIDANRDGLMTPAEWVAYVNKLDTLALEAATRANDKKGQELLTAVIAHHYKNLAQCISSVTGKAHDESLNAAQFAELTPTIEKQCDVKFRYTLHAGPPPFEWIAEKRSSVSAHQVSEWFAKQLDNAKSGWKPLTQQQLNFVTCIEGSLKEKRAAKIDRKMFYDIMATCS